MKRTLSFLLTAALLLFMGCLTALAETQADKSPIFNESIQNGATPGFCLYEKCGYQPVYVPVTLVFHNEDGTATEALVAPKVLELEYRYGVHVSSFSGTVVGGVLYTDDTSPRLTVDDQSSVDLRVVVGSLNLTPEAQAAMSLRVSCTEIRLPSAGVLGVGNGYTLTVRGGLFTVTYDSVIHFDAQGNITDRETITVKRAYNFTESGTI